MYGIYKMLYNKDIVAIDEMLKEKRNELQQNLDAVLECPITDNRKKKDLICIVSAFLKESHVTIDQLRNRLSWGFDVEHIHATGDGTVDVDRALQNSIGNLMLLESSINRSIKDKPFKEKVEWYSKSAYAVARQMAEMKCWETQQIRERLKAEKKAILDFYNPT